MIDFARLGRLVLQAERRGTAAARARLLLDSPGELSAWWQRTAAAPPQGRGVDAI